MKLDRNNDPAIRDFENWVRRELYGPNDERPQETEEDKECWCATSIYCPIHDKPKDAKK